MKDLKPHQRGLAMTMIGVIVLTPDALLLRLVETDPWTAMFWRSLLAGLCLLALNAAVERRNPLRTVAELGRSGIFCVVTFAGSNACFVISINHTTAANTLVILAAMPFMAALLSVLVLRRQLPARTWSAIALAMAGIVVVFWGRLGDGNTFGDLMALCCAFFMAVTLATVGARPHINTLAAVGFGALLAAAFALAMGAAPTAPPAADFVWLALNGVIVVPIAMGLITYGPKLISAPEVSLIMLLEAVLGPLWVWLVLAETPAGQTLAGGAIVITAVLVNAWLGLRADPV